MVGMFEPARASECRLVDAGAGIGSLSAAFLERCLSGELVFKRVALDAYEIDHAICSDVVKTLEGYSQKLALVYEIHCNDFIESSVNRIQFEAAQGFTHAILNPPYKKISAYSRHRRMLSAVGIETVNLYSAFLALTILLMAQGGEIVAILPAVSAMVLITSRFVIFYLLDAPLHEFICSPREIPRLKTTVCCRKM